MAVSALVVYLFLGAASHVTGGREFPLGVRYCTPDA